MLALWNDEQQWPWFAYIAFAIVLLVLMYSTFTERPIPEKPVAESEQTCIGRPILVGYPFPPPMDAAFENPWECRSQCDDGVRRYIHYSNGKATQCGELPGCLDWGEDNRTTCLPPLVSGTDAL